ncbi:DUF4350 domain-containing protein [Lysobacter sp. GCM10012299]|uniref:DUF4350 domain-containing protein n=1 Tax=Lysobacter sp. GCM10012299 TaxID=3317333 RepID=UPI003623934C
MNIGISRDNLQAVIITTVLLALAGLGVAWWLHNYERVEESVDMPRTGEARSNPLYVLKLALRADGVKAEARPNLQRERHRLGERDTVLLYSDPRTLSREDGRALLEWVAKGGHLLVRTPPPGPFAPGTTVPVLSQLDVVPARTPLQCAGWDVPGQDKHVEFCKGRRAELLGTAGELVLGWADSGGNVYMRIAHGRGYVDVLSDFDFLDNDSLKDAPHIVLTRQLLAPNYKAGTVHLIYDADMPSFWWTLVRYSWMAWLPLLLALLAWLWLRAQRFGPLQPAPASERRSLLEHVVASGEHVYRYGYAHLLHEAVRNAFLARLRRRDPQAAALGGEAQVLMLSERFNVPAAEIRDALSTPIARDHAAFRSRIATLVRLRNQL